MNQSLPIVAIVGRANVGKSSLFNALIGRREAIVAKEAGTTRDNVTAQASFGHRDFWLVDTAGLKAPEDEFEISIQQQIAEAAGSADVIMVVVEADVAPTAADRQVATMALKSRKPVILVINKSDKQRRGGPDWQNLGIKLRINTSISQKTGLQDLLEALEAVLPTIKHKHKGADLKVALLGRPNVGKSTLFNALAKKQQALVSAKAGTTRDVNRVTVRFEGQGIEFMDSAGIRRSGKIERGVEKFSVLRSLAAIEEADICLVLLDVDEASVQLDQKIAGMVAEAGKGLILVVSKWDRAEPAGVSRETLSAHIARDFAFVPWAPLVFTSAVTGQNVTKIFELVTEIANTRRSLFKTTELNKWLQKAIYDHPPAGLKNRQPKLNYIVQEDGTGLPSFKIFGGHTKFLHWSYKRYLERSFRELWPLAGTPLKFWFIEKHSRQDIK